MLKLNWLLWVGLVVHGAIAWAVLGNHEYPSWLGMLLFSFVAVSVMGMIWIAMGLVVWGAVMYIVGCIAFSPVGVIGALGAFIST